MREKRDSLQWTSVGANIVAPRCVVEDVTALLSASDARLQELSVGELEQLCQNDSELTDERLWPVELRSLLVNASPESRKSLHLIVESYYGSLMRSAPDREFWRLNVLAYNRVIPLRLGYNESMGHRPADSLLVAGESLAAFPQLDAEEVRILDIGCGTGELLEDLLALGFTQLEGIDVSAAAIARARVRLASTPARVQSMSLRRLLELQPAGRYEVLTLCDVLEHLPRSSALGILQALRVLLAPGGIMVVITPSAITGPHDLDFLPHRVGPAGLHLHEYRLRELENLLQEAGFRNLRSPLGTPSGRRLGRPSQMAFKTKLVLEPILEIVPHPLAALVTDRLYFRGVACSRD